MYIQQASATDGAVASFVSCEIDADRDFIVEGYQVHPQLAARLTKQHGASQVRAIFLVKTHRRSLENGFRQGNPETDWILKGTKEPETFSRIAKMLSEYSQEIEKGAKQHNLQVFHTDREFQNGLKRASAYLTQ